MAQTSTLSKFPLGKNSARLLLLLLFFTLNFVGKGLAQSTLPISYEGPWDALPNGWSGQSFYGPWAEDLGPSTTGGSAGFDFPEDYLVAQFDGPAGEVSYFLASQYGSYNGGFIVSESTDGLTYTQILNHSIIPAYDGTAENRGALKYVVNPASTTRYIKFEYTANDGVSIMLDQFSATAPSTEPDINIKQGTDNIASFGSYNFGSTPEGTSITKTFTLENLGIVDLQLTGTPIIELSGANASMFSVVQPTTNTVAAGASTPFEVTFTPAGSGDYTSTLKISSNDTDEPVYTINLFGTGQVLPPDITSISPSMAGPGTKISVLGLNFVSLRSVTVGGLTATYTRISDTQIDVIVPEGLAAGSRLVRVTNSVGFDEHAFTVITISPKSGTQSNIVTITGENFPTTRNAIIVRFSGSTVNATFAAITTQTEIKVRVPADAKTGSINVIFSSTGETVQTSTFTVTGPTITGFSPLEGFAGDIVTITGSGFVKGTSTVLFSGPNGPIQSIGVTVDEATQIIKATVPQGAITGVIYVTNATGTGQSATAFTVLAPTITLTGSLSPFKTIVNVPSAPQSYVVSGTYLTDFVNITAPENFQISLVDEEASYGSSITLTPENGSVASTTIYVRYLPVTSGSHSGQITHISGTASSSLTVQGSTPTILISQTTMSLSTNAGSSTTGLYTVEAYYLLDNANVVVDVSGLPGDYTISRTGLEGSYVKTITFEPGTDIFDNTLALKELYVKFAPTVSGESSAQITHSSEGANTETLTVNGSAITPLPVELIAFNARKQSGGVLLTWATASEQDNDYFEVQMTDNLKSEFKTVGKVHSKVGTTALRQDYKFDHKGGFLGTRYYRLKQVDFDGTTDYSKVVEVSAGQLDLAAEPRVYPNPITPNSKLEFSAAEAGKLNVSVVNMSGTKIQSKSYDIEAGENTIELNLSDNLPTGIYILMTEFNGKTQQVKLLKQ